MPADTLLKFVWSFDRKFFSIWRYSEIQFTAKYLFRIFDKFVYRVAIKEICIQFEYIIFKNRWLIENKWFTIEIIIEWRIIVFINWFFKCDWLSGEIGNKFWIEMIHFRTCFILSHFFKSMPWKYNHRIADESEPFIVIYNILTYFKRYLLIKAWSENNW